MNGKPLPPGGDGASLAGSARRAAMLRWSRRPTPACAFA